MGGFGSGRYDYATTPTVDECHTIDVNVLSDATKHPGGSAPYRWRDKNGHGEEVASIRIRVIKDNDPLLAGGSDPDRNEITDSLEGRATHFGFEYTVTSSNGKKHEYDYRVPLEYTAVHFGGVRPWFRCPECSDRVGKLHRPLNEIVFRCRECFDLRYRSSRTSGNAIEEAELRYRRAFAKADAKDHRPHPNTDPWFPERPKGMHHETFDRLVADVQQARQEWRNCFQEKLQDLSDHLP